MLTLGLILAVFGAPATMESEGAEGGEHYLMHETNEEPTLGEVIVGQVGQLIVYNPTGRIIIGQVDRIEIGSKEPPQIGVPTYKIVRGKVTLQPVEIVEEEAQVAEPAPPD